MNSSLESPVIRRALIIPSLDGLPKGCKKRRIGGIFRDSKKGLIGALGLPAVGIQKKIPMSLQGFQKRVTVDSKKGEG